MGKWVSPNNQYRMKVNPSFGEVGVLPMKHFEQNGHWNLRTPVTYELVTREVETTRRKSVLKFDAIRYTLVLERQPLFYIIVVIIPCSLFGFLSVCTFFLPIESGERLPFCTAILLSQILELLVLSELLPPAKESGFPILGEYVLTSVLYIAMSVVINVVVTYVYHRPEAAKIPRWILKLVHKTERWVHVSCNFVW